MNMKIIRRAMFALAGFAALIMTGSSAAYWAQRLDVVNEFRFSDYSIEIKEEEFVSPENWYPGVETAKDVTIENTGNVPVFVKVVLSQKWERKDGGVYPLTFGTPPEYAALINWSDDVYLLNSGVTTDPTVSPSLGISLANTVMDVDSVPPGKWVLLNEVPEPDADDPDLYHYTLYYMGVLEEGNATPLIMESVTMNSNIKPHILEQNKTYNTTTKDWETVTDYNTEPSYENATYTLTVTMTTVQAVGDAVLDAFDALDDTEEKDIIERLAGDDEKVDNPEDLNKSCYDSATHTLSFEGAAGNLTYTTTHCAEHCDAPDCTHLEEYLFMSDLNMIPGGEYEHEMTIKNNTSGTYRLYLQAEWDEEQSGELNGLLENISMIVLLNGVPIYEGTASGIQGVLGNLQDPNAVYLGTYAPGDEDDITIELALDPETPVGLAGLLSRIIWVFLVEGEDPPPDVPSVPGTTPSDPPGPGEPSEPSDPSEPSGPSGPSKPSDIIDDFTEPIEEPAEPTEEPLLPPGPHDGPDGPAGPGTPRLGDDSSGRIWYIVTMVLSGLCLTGCIAVLIKTRKKVRS